MQDDLFNAMVKNAWNLSALSGNPMVVLKNKLKLLKGEIKSWRSSHSNYDVSTARKLMLEWELKAESKTLDEEESVSFRKARADFFHAEKMQTSSLKQKSRIKWAVEGDENSRFFHSMVRGRFKKNVIHGLSYNGNWVENPSTVKKTIYDHFKLLYIEPPVARPGFISQKFRTVSTTQVQALETSFTEEEIKQVVCSCEGSSKAPGPDRFSMNFVKKFWDVIKSDFVEALKYFEQTGQLPRGCNSTFLSLIPKTPDP